jgi:hypothetical protein
MDPWLVLDPAALSEAADRWDEAEADLDAACAAGLLHWCRYLELDPGDDQLDLVAALRLLAPLRRARPDLVPASAWQVFDEDDFALPADGELAAAQGTLLLQATLETGSQADLNRAVDLLQRAVALGQVPGSELVPPSWLANLGAALQTRFDRTGSPADLDAGVSAGREAVAATPADHPSRPGSAAVEPRSLPGPGVRPMRRWRRFRGRGTSRRPAPAPVPGCRPPG